MSNYSTIISCMSKSTLMLFPPLLQCGWFKVYLLYNYNMHCFCSYKCFLISWLNSLSYDSIYWIACFSIITVGCGTWCQSPPHNPTDSHHLLLIGILHHLLVSDQRQAKKWPYIVRMWRRRAMKLMIMWPLKPIQPCDVWVL